MKNKEIHDNLVKACGLLIECEEPINRALPDLDKLTSAVAIAKKALAALDSNTVS